jgi:hypothetical protein
MPILQREQCFSRPIRTIGTFEYSHVMPLDISLQRYGDAHFHKSVVAKLATATPQKPMDWVRKAQVDAGQRAG